MTYVVNESCIKCKLMDCQIDGLGRSLSGRLFLRRREHARHQPDECIDCGVCEPECTHLLARLLPAGAGQNALSGEPSITVGNIKEYQADNSIKSRFLPVRSVATIHGQAILWADGAQDSSAIG